MVTGDRFEVIGRWKVTVHDSTAAYPPWDKPYSLLNVGDVYDMKLRKVVARASAGRRLPVENH